MIHPPDEGAGIAEHTFDLGGVCELELRMQVAGVLDRPPLPDAFVYRRAVGPQLRSRLHLAVQEVRGVVPLWMDAVDEVERYLPRTDLLAHDEYLVAEERLVELHNMLQNVSFLGQMRSKDIEPMTDRRLREFSEVLCLENWDLFRPAPQEHPELRKRELAVLEPCVRQEREPATAAAAPVPRRLRRHLSRCALRTEDIFAEQRSSDELFNLGITWYLIE